MDENQRLSYSEKSRLPPSQWVGHIQSVEGLNRTKSQNLPMSKREFFLPDCLLTGASHLLLLEQPASLWTETRALALQILDLPASTIK